MIFFIIPHKQKLFLIISLIQVVFSVKLAITKDYLIYYVLKLYQYNKGIYYTIKNK